MSASNGRDLNVAQSSQRIFISHSSKDQGKINEQIIPLLARHNIHHWYSKDNIQSASQWEREILRGLRDCNWFMLVMSPHSAHSEWVKDELNWAISHRENHIIPVVLQQCDPLNFHLRLPRLQMVDFTDPASRPEDRLMQIIRDNTQDDDPMKMAPSTKLSVLENAYHSLEIRIVDSPDFGLDEACRAIQVAISYGAPIFNEDGIEGKVICAKIYLRCASLVIENINSDNISLEIKFALSQIVSQLPSITETSAVDSAWKLRRIFDQILDQRVMIQTQMMMEKEIASLARIHMDTPEFYTAIDRLFHDICEEQVGNKSDYASVIAAIYVSRKLVELARQTQSSPDGRQKNHAAFVIQSNLNNFSENAYPRSNEDERIEEVLKWFKQARDELRRQLAPVK